MELSPEEEERRLLKKRQNNIALITRPIGVLAKIEDPERRLNYRVRAWHMGAHAGSVMRVSEEELKVATANHLVDLGAIEADAGRIGQAAEYVERAEKLDADVLRHRSYIGLIAQIAPLMPDIARRFSFECQAAERFLDNHGRFRTLVGDPAKTICVVGNSPCELGKGEGGFIDSHDIVIRFNDFDTGPKYRNDYGRKTDIWSHAAILENLWRREDERFIHNIASGTNLYWRAPSGLDFLRTHREIGGTVESIPSRLYFEVAQRVGFHPSNGLLLVCWLDRIRGGLAGVSLRGFSMVDQTEGPSRYFTDGVTRRKDPPHQWRFEREVLNSLIGT